MKNNVLVSVYLDKEIGKALPLILKTKSLGIYNGLIPKEIFRISGQIYHFFY